MNNQKPNYEKSTRELSLEWWNNLPSDRKTQICDTNTDITGSIRRWETLTGNEITKLWYRRNTSLYQSPVICVNCKEIYNNPVSKCGCGGSTFQKTHPNNTKPFNNYPPEPEIFNEDNPVRFSVKELKEFSEQFASRVLKRGEKDNITGFWSLCKEMFYEKFKRKSYTVKREFNIELFEAYINKFNPTNKLHAVNTLITSLSEDKEFDFKFATAIINDALNQYNNEIR